MKSIPKSSLKSLSLAHRPLVRGTLILTITGLITRLIGFFYRIYLSRLFGEEGMGIYQLLAPVHALSFSLCAAAYQTAISKFVAEYTGQNRRQFLPLYSGLLLSLPLSLLALYILYGNADLIAVKLLLEPRTAPMLRILAFSIPFSSVHACINGYFYGVKRTAPPAVAQLLEQLTRVGCVYLTTSHILSLGKTPSINVAVFGLTIGEIMSMCVCLLALFHACSSDIFPQGITCTAAAGSAVSGTSILRPAILRYRQRLLLFPILRMALPLLSGCRRFVLDDCDLDYARLAELRDEFPERNLVWRVRFGIDSALTDTQRIWSVFVTDENCDVLKYCTEVLYLDVGHEVDLNDFHFIPYMTKLQVLIVMRTGFSDCELLTHCPDLEYLEIFSSGVTDLSPLAECRNLQHLNISNLPEVTDISPLYGLTQLKRLRITMDNVPEEQKEEIARRLPDCEMLFDGINPTDNGWRRNRQSELVPRYALLREQMGYDGHASPVEFINFPEMEELGYTKESVFTRS